MNSNRSKLKTTFTTVMLSVSIVLLANGTSVGQLERLRYTFSSDSKMIERGQSARLEVANTGDQSLVVWLFFRDNEGKVLIKKEVKIKPGASQALEYSFTGPNNPLKDDDKRKAGLPFIGSLDPNHIELRAQFGTTEAKLIASLKPTLRMLEKSGQTLLVIGPEGFKELRPGNDPTKKLSGN